MNMPQPVMLIAYRVTVHQLIVIVRVRVRIVRRLSGPFCAGLYMLISAGFTEQLMLHIK